MTNKIYDKTTSFIKKNKKLLIEYIIFITVMASLIFIKFDYEIYSPGGLKNLSERIEVEDYYDSEGTFNLTYVTARPGNIPNILLSFLIPSWDLVSLDESRIENEDYEDILARGRIDLNNVSENAIKVAFENANLNYKLSKNDVTVYYIFENAKTNLKVGDIIKEIDNKEINSTEDITNIINTKKENEKIELKIIRNGKLLTKEAKLYKDEDRLLMGIYLTSVIEVIPEIDVEFKFNSNEMGASSGLMSALEIYNKITEVDITKGRTIAGTGTINMDGTVGEIGGVKYKLKGAVKKGAEIFIVPSENYDEALDIKKEMKYNIKLLKAENFKQVLEELKEI